MPIGAGEGEGRGVVGVVSLLYVAKQHDGHLCDGVMGVE